MMRNANRRARNRGLTLIELMVVVAIIGILAAVVVSAYDSSVRKSRRNGAESDLTTLAQYMERIYTENSTYQPGGVNPALPFTTSPQNGATAFYNLTINVNTGATYTLRATPIGKQLIDGMLELDSTGAKRWDADHDGAFEATEQHW